MLQIWIIKRFASVLVLQPILLGVILLSQRLWVLGGILVGVGTVLLIFAEVYAESRTRGPTRRNLTMEARQSLAMFHHVSLETNANSTAKQDGKGIEYSDERTSLVSQERMSRVRSRGSLASVLEMMSIILATMPSHTRNRSLVPLGELFPSYILPRRVDVDGIRHGGSRRLDSN